MSINYSSYHFTDPVSAASWDPPYRSGIYAILTPDSSIKPKPYRVLYFGESENMSDRGFWKGHHRYRCFISEAASESNLNIAVYLMPNSTSEERRKIEQKLVNDYDPPCNRG